LLAFIAIAQACTRSDEATREREGQIGEAGTDTSVSTRDGGDAEAGVDVGVEDDSGAEVDAEAGSDTGCACSTEDECCDGCAPYPETKECEKDGDPLTVDRCDGEGSCVTSERYCDAHDCWKIPPTGQTQCYGTQWERACTTMPCNSDGSPTFCGQDAQYPDNPRTFRESDAGSDVIVTDSLTGLIWQKTHATFENWQTALDRCDALDYANKTDWRLPDAHELASLVSYNRFGPASDFPDMPSVSFWSSSSCHVWTGPGQAVYVSFDGGSLSIRYKEAIHNDDPERIDVRCVRGGSSPVSGADRFQEIVADGPLVVLDRLTGLVWQKDYAASKTWKEALKRCEASRHGGYHDWRLPNVNELRSLVAYEKEEPASDFPAMPSSWFWSSSSGWSSARVVSFREGRVASSTKTVSGGVRCVRGGP
jgi:hypothetical protein